MKKNIILFVLALLVLSIAAYAANDLLMREKVKCIFNGAAAKQSCISKKGSCSSISSCLVNVMGKKNEKVEWQSTCGNKIIVTTIDGKDEIIQFDCKPPEIKEKVKCVFNGATVMQSCMSKKGSCSSISACLVSVFGEGNEKVEWQSTCGSKILVTTIDGKDESIQFDCKPPEIKEKVTCTFDNIIKKETCSSTKGSCTASPMRCLSNQKCPGPSTCTLEVKGKQGEKVTWKSTCNGVAETTIDGKNENIAFNCKIPCKKDNDCAGMLCPQVIGGDKPKCNIKTGDCYCGGICGDKYCDEVEKKDKTCLKDCK